MSQKKLTCITSFLRGHSAVRLHTMQRKRKTEDKKAALLLLSSVILCFEAYCALTASKSSARAFKPQNSPKVQPDRASSLTWGVKLFKSLCPVKRLKTETTASMQKSSKQAKDTSTATVTVNIFHANVSKKVTGILSVVSQRPMNDEALWSLAKVTMKENEQRKTRWQRDFTSGAQQLRQWDNEQLMQATNATQKKQCGWSELTGPKCAKSTRHALGV